MGKGAPPGRRDRMECPVCGRDVAVTSYIHRHARQSQDGKRIIAGTKCEASNRPRDWTPPTGPPEPIDPPRVEEGKVNDAEPLILMTYEGKRECEIGACQRPAVWSIEGAGYYPHCPMVYTCDSPHLLTGCKEILGMTDKTRPMVTPLPTNVAAAVAAERKPELRLTAQEKFHQRIQKEMRDGSN